LDFLETHPLIRSLDAYRIEPSTAQFSIDYRTAQNLHLPELAAPTTVRPHPQARPDAATTNRARPRRVGD